MGFEEFRVAAAEARRIAFSFSNPLIVHHYDADGLAAGAVVKLAFSHANKKCRMLGVKKLDDGAIERFKTEREIIFVDLGNFERVDELKDVLIIDHHQPFKGEANGKLKTQKPQINPMLYGIDGGSELSAAGTAYFTFGNNADLALVGALGDMQYPLQGANRTMLEEGIARGEIRKVIDLRLYGRFSRPLVQFLAYSDDFFIPGITYSEERAQALLESLGIELKKGERWRVYADLELEEKKQLVSAIAILLPEAKRQVLIGEVYDLLTRPRGSSLYDANEFSTVLNACGRHGKPELGIAICVGDEAAYREASSLLALHKRMIREGIAFAKANITDLGEFLFLDARGNIDESIVGIVCGIVLHDSEKPIIGVANGEGGDLKISARVAKQAGLNLGSMVSYVGAKVGGVGGGHALAAGAGIPRDKLNEFLLAAAENLRAQKAKK